MVCFSKDCFWVKKHGDCFYDGMMGSNHPKTPEECEFFKTPTNYDRLIRKTPEELADWLDGSFRHAEWCDTSKFPNGDCMEVPCLGCILDWLKQEASE